VRNATLKALTIRAMQYFDKYGKGGDIREIGENLRTSLKPFFQG